MFTEILSDTAGQSALSRFFTTNTWPAAQTFTLSATFSAGFTSTGLAQFTSSSTTVGGVVSRANGTISTNPTGYANTSFQAIGAEGTANHSLFEACAGQNQINIRRRNGTYSAVTALASGNIIGDIAFQGWGTSFTTNALIRSNALEAFTGSATGANLEFFTTTAGGTTLTSRLTLGVTANFTVPVISGGNYVRVTTAQTPATSAAAGTTGDIAWDDTYLYVRMSTGWRRIALGAAF